MSEEIRLGGACLNQTPMDWEGNVKNIKSAISAAKENKVNILCLPELCITGYGCEDMFHSEWVPQKALQKLVELIPFTSGITVTLGLPFIFNGLCYNTVATVRNKKLLGIYAKHNLANDGVHYEPRWFSSWPYNKIETIEFHGIKTNIGSIWLGIDGLNVGFEICEDAWHEDRPACNLIENSIDLILNPSASHFAFGKEEFRENLVINSSKDFNCIYLYTNLLGNEAGRMIYDGDILIAKQGELIGHNQRLSFEDFNLLWIDYNKRTGTTSKSIKQDWKNKYEEFGQALPLAMFDYLRKSKSSGFVLSLSGGADSGTIAIMVYRMVIEGCRQLGINQFCEKLGLQNEYQNPHDIVKDIFTTAYQATVNSSEKTKNAAKSLAEYIGSTHYEWNIDNQVEQYTSTIEKALSRKLEWETDDIALQNIQARTRSPIIWMLANIKNSLLLTTSNRSEGDVGYATMDGDTSGSISPIAAVDKYFILSWLEYAEKEYNHSGLRLINNLTPTAELRPLEDNQTDEDDLMPYEALVKIEHQAIKYKKSPKEIYDILENQYDPRQLKIWISKFFKLWARNQWKRERIAPSFHLDDFNVDPRTWCRFPILSSGFSEELKELESYGTGS